MCPIDSSIAQVLTQAIKAVSYYEPVLHACFLSIVATEKSLTSNVGNFTAYVISLSIMLVGLWRRGEFQAHGNSIGRLLYQQVSILALNAHLRNEAMTTQQGIIGMVIWAIAGIPTIVSYVN